MVLLFRWPSWWALVSFSGLPSMWAWWRWPPGRNTVKRVSNIRDVTNQTLRGKSLTFFYSAIILSRYTSLIEEVKLVINEKVANHKWLGVRHLLMIFLPLFYDVRSCPSAIRAASTMYLHYSHMQLGLVFFSGGGGGRVQYFMSDSHRLQEGWVFMNKLVLSGPFYLLLGSSLKSKITS